MTSPHDWMSGDTLGPANSIRPETAQPDLGEARSAVSNAGTAARDGDGVLNVPNMSNVGTHTAGR